MSKEIKRAIPFYKKPLVIILLFIFFPPVGIPLFLKFINKPSKKTRVYISIAWAMLCLISIISSSIESYRTYTIDGKQVTIACYSYCKDIEKYGDKDILNILASIGIKRITSASVSPINNQATVNVGDSSKESSVLKLELSGDKLVKIYNKSYSSIVYYSSNSGDQIAKYPSDDKISSIRKAEDDKKAADKVAADAKQKQEEADAKAAADKKAAEQAQAEAEAKAAAEKYPPEYDSIGLCEKTFHSRYPYNGSEVHSILGVIANTNYGTDSRLYKVEVTVENAFGAKRNTTMECVVKKIDSTTIQVSSFYIY